MKAILITLLEKVVHLCPYVKRADLDEKEVVEAFILASPQGTCGQLRGRTYHQCLVAREGGQRRLVGRCRASMGPPVGGCLFYGGQQGAALWRAGDAEAAGLLIIRPFLVCIQFSCRCLQPTMSSSLVGGFLHFALVHTPAWEYLSSGRQESDSLGGVWLKSPFYWLTCFLLRN